MAFWAYENFPTNRVTVHVSSCGFCKDGKGKNSPNKGDLNGKWHGPYSELEHAISALAPLHRNQTVHSCCRGEFPSRGQSGYKRFELPLVDESTLSLDELFERRMFQIYVSLRDEVGYTAIRFLGSVRRHGGVEHAKRSLRRPVEMQAGFERLRAEGRLHQTMEAHVVDPHFRSLFTEPEIAEAERRLRSSQ